MDVRIRSEVGLDKDITYYNTGNKILFSMK